MILPAGTWAVGRDTGSPAAGPSDHRTQGPSKAIGGLVRRGNVAQEYGRNKKDRATQGRPACNPSPDRKADRRAQSERMTNESMTNERMTKQSTLLEAGYPELTLTGKGLWCATWCTGCGVRYPDPGPIEGTTFTSVCASSKD